MFDCAFHPSQPVLACGLNSGCIRLFRGHDEDTPFARWTPDDRFRVDVPSHIHCLDWNVREISFKIENNVHVSYDAFFGINRWMELD